MSEEVTGVLVGLLCLLGVSVCAVEFRGCNSDDDRKTVDVTRAQMDALSKCIAGGRSATDCAVLVHGVGR